MKPKVGHIEFLNCLPLYYGLIKKHALLDIELVKGTPTELNRLLLQGALDISPISSIEYARNSDKLILFPDFTVSSDGEVKSILLMSIYPLEELNGKKVALTSTSSTSQTLLKIILKFGYNIEPDYIVMPPNLCDMFTEADAALLIGDIALKCFINSKEFYIYDLGREWKKLTNKKMVYAVWAINKDFLKINKDLVKYTFEIFKKSMEYSKKHIFEIAEYATRWEPFSREFLFDYFRSLHFGFDESYQDGLLHFYKLAKEVNDLNVIPKLEFVNYED
jgi:chorismate dehydratase